MPIVDEPEDRYVAALVKMSEKVERLEDLKRAIRLEEQERRMRHNPELDDTGLVAWSLRLERQEQLERTTPSIDSRVYHGEGIDAADRHRVEEIRAWLLVAFVVAIVLAILFAPRGPWWPVP